MAQPIQIILMRQLAGYLNVPLFSLVPTETCFFTMNRLRSFLVGGSMKQELCLRRSGPRLSRPEGNSEGHPVPPEDVPLMITITKKRPAYQRFFIRGLDGVRRHVDVASIPIAGLDGDFLGGVALFWEVSD